MRNANEIQQLEKQLTKAQAEREQALQAEGQSREAAADKAAAEAATMLPSNGEELPSYGAFAPYLKDNPDAYSDPGNGVIIIQKK